MGRGQLRQLEDRVARRRANNRFYREALADTDGVSFMPEAEYGRASFWLTCVVIDEDRFGCDVQSILRHLEADDIEARPVWKPMHLQPVFECFRVRGGEVSADLFRRGLSLPSGSSLENADLRRIFERIVGTPRSG